MRARTPAVLVAVAAAVLVAGCGKDAGDRPSVPATPSPCVNAVVTPDSGTSRVCLRVGGTLRLKLTRGETVTEQGPALTRVSAGVYRGVRSGRAELAVERRCPSPRPGEAACLAIARRQVTVDVR